MNGTGPGMDLVAAGTACTMLAAALLLLPGPVGAARLARMRPQRCGTPRRSITTAAVPALAAAVGLILLGPGGAVAGGLIAVTIRRRRRAAAGARRVRAATTQLADAVARLAEELRIGAHPSGALAGCSADGPVAARLLGAAAAAAALGDDVPAALRAGARRHPAASAEIERLAAGWALADQHGIPLADLLRQVADDMRWRLRFGAAVRAQLAGPRATAAVLTALPLLGLGLGQLIGADPVTVLRSGLLGQVLLVVGVLLAIAGEAWSASVLRAAVPR